MSSSGAPHGAAARSAALRALIACQDHKRLAVLAGAIGVLAASEVFCNRGVSQMFDFREEGAYWPWLLQLARRVLSYLNNLCGCIPAEASQQPLQPGLRKQVVSRCTLSKGTTQLPSDQQACGQFTNMHKSHET